MKLKIIFLAGLLMITHLTHGNSSKAPVFLREDGRWKSFTHGEKTTKSCFIVSEPTTQKGDFKKRGTPHVLVTHRPGKKSYDVVSIVAGYTYKPESEVEIKIKDKTFTLFTNDDTAWTKNTKDDAALVQAMRQGVTMTVEGTSSRGNAITDTYALKGFQRGMNMIDTKCPRVKNKK